MIKLVPDLVSTELVSSEIDEELARDITEYSEKSPEAIAVELATNGIDAETTIGEIRSMIAAASMEWQRAAADPAKKR